MACVSVQVWRSCTTLDGSPLNIGERLEPPEAQISADRGGVCLLSQSKQVQIKDKPDFQESRVDG